MTMHSKTGKGIIYGDTLIFRERRKQQRRLCEEREAYLPPPPPRQPKLKFSNDVALLEATSRGDALEGWR